MPVAGDSLRNRRFLRKYEPHLLKGYYDHAYTGKSCTERDQVVKESMNSNISKSTDHEAIPEPYQMISTDHGSSADCIPFSTPQGKTKHMLSCLAPHNSSGKKEEMLPSSNKILFGDIPDCQQLSAFRKSLFSQTQAKSKSIRCINWEIREYQTQLKQFVLVLGY